jgi:hypothetical protein
MPKYKIHAFYKTGNSFGSHDEDTILEMSWTDLSKAKAALQRIQEHYRWYSDMDGWNPKNVPEPKWHKGMQYKFCLKVELDNGAEVEFSAPWCGYFEELKSAKIITEEANDNDMEIVF